MNLPGSFEYLAQENGWPSFTLSGLEVGPEGRLTLSRLPYLTSLVGDGIEGLPPADAAVDPVPAGIAVTRHCDCTVFLSDPTRHQVWRIDTCEPDPRPLLLLTGPGSAPGEIDRPRGLAIAGYGGGQRLFIADSGNHRILVLDAETQQPLGVWAQANAFTAPAAGSAPGRLDDPWGLATDRAGNVYVVDHGNARLQKFSGSGNADLAFADALLASPQHTPDEPIDIACAGADEGERIYVLDKHGGAVRVLIFDTEGRVAGPGAWLIDEQVSTIAATPDAVYAGTRAGIILKFSTDGSLMSRLAGISPIAAVTAGCEGQLLASPGGLPLARHSIDTGFGARGWFVAGPFETTARPIVWRRAQADASIPAASHLQLYTFTSDKPDAVTTVPGAVEPFGDPGWQAQPIDETDVLVLGEDARDALAKPPPAAAADEEKALETGYFWLGGVLWGDGVSSPTLRQVRIDHQPETPASYLPAIYREGPSRRLPAELILASLDSELGLVDEVVAELPGLFDPWAAPVEWLPWLASWLDFELIEDWSESDKRRYIAEAMGLYMKRGTIEGLRRYIEIYAGVSARIEEPAMQASLFVLDDQLSLGFNTMLAPAYEQGAVLGATATLGQSHLISAEEMGVPLFSDVVNRFAVIVYGAGLSDERRQALERVLERERPAHTDYHLCVIKPDMRVGRQARIGIDSLVAGTPPDLRLGDEAGLGFETVLANLPPRSRRIGAGMRVGGVI